MLPSDTTAAEGDTGFSARSSSSPGVFRVVLTGGPCAGKTTALCGLRTRLTELGLHVVTVPENATMVFSNSGGYWPGWAANREHHIELQRVRRRCLPRRPHACRGLAAH